MIRFSGLAFIGSVLAGIGLGIYCTRIEPRRYEGIDVDITADEWPAELDGCLIALVADLHIGRSRRGAWTCPALPSALEAVRNRHPDVVLACGDFGFQRWDPPTLADIADLFEAPVRVAVLGNHDHGRGRTKARALRCELERRGFIVLCNEVRPVRLHNKEVWLAGLDDAASRHDDMPVVLSALPDGAHPVILLTHTPDGIKDVQSGIFDVALSGHTHGGQLAVPYLNHWVLRRFGQTYFDRGLYEIKGLPLFVTKGLGMVGLHARFRSRPEVAFIRLFSRNSRAS